MTDKVEDLFPHPLIHVEYLRVVDFEDISHYATQHVRKHVPPELLFANERVGEIRQFWIQYPWQKERPWKFERAPDFRLGGL